MSVGCKKSLSQKGKTPRGRYACAEDLCDAYEPDGANTPAETTEKPRRHAVRLMDELREASPPPSRASRASRAAREETDPAACVRPVVKPLAPRTKPPRTSLPPVELPEAAGYDILSVRPTGEGETVAVTLSVPAEEGGAPEKLRLYLLVEQYAELGVRPGPIDPADARELLAAGRFCAAVKRGMYLLQYGDQSARRLAYKLTARGVERPVAEEAAAYLVRKGYIHEDDTARRRAEQGIGKLWGPRRIREDLRANGFSPAAVEEAMDALREVDFASNCAELIRRRYAPVPPDRAARQRVVAALLRYGYDMDTVRAVLRDED